VVIAVTMTTDENGGHHDANGSSQTAAPDYTSAAL
jgi:hypothetical protein